MISVDFPIKLLIVDDHQLVCDAIRFLLKDKQDISIVGEATRGEQAIQLVRKLEVDIILLDINMPDINGIELIRRLKVFDKRIKIIVLTAIDDEQLAIKLMKSGIIGYLTKGSSEQELYSAILSAVYSKKYVSSDITQRLLDINTNKIKKNAAQVLSARELEIMLMLCTGMRMREIAEKLCIAHKTVNTHRLNIFKKLNVKNNIELTQLALSEGLMQIE